MLVPAAKYGVNRTETKRLRSLETYRTAKIGIIITNRFENRCEVNCALFFLANPVTKEIECIVEKPVHFVKIAQHGFTQFFIFDKFCTQTQARAGRAQIM